VIARREIKIIITGPMGAGKTTAIAAVSDVEPIKTEAVNNDLVGHAKAQTTVAMDYGEVRLADGDRLRLYGTPGQGRFNFMWDILAKGALGVIILLDLTRPDPKADIRTYLQDFAAVIRNSSAVIGVGRAHEKTSSAAIAQVAAEMGFAIPVFRVDVRKRDDVLLLLETLFSQVEMAAYEPAEPIAAHG
jgi:uncharacterized protein